MYPRQFKQFLKTAQPDFDERRYGSIADLMRACQKDGLLRLERDRQGALRVFASGGAPRATVPHGWGLGKRENGSETPPETPPVVDVGPGGRSRPPIVDAQVTEVVEDGAGAEAEARRAAREDSRAEEKKPAAKKKKAQSPANRGTRHRSAL